jgi:hypothetical protein
MTIALALSALAVIGGLTAFSFYLARLLSSAVRDWKTAVADQRDAEAKRSVLQKAFDDLVRLNDETRAILSTKEAELIRETLARKSVEKHREQLLAELAKTGNPSAVASQIRKELEALAALGSPK